MASIVSTSSYMADMIDSFSHMWKTMINLLIEGFNCGRIWALVILSVLRTNDLT